MLRVASVAAAFLLVPVAAQAQTAADHGAKVYQRCAACHLPNGQGVPGAFPALAGRVSGAAAKDEGRDYLVMAVVTGLMGEIEVEGKTIRGVMPAQAGLADADVAAVLNYAMSLPAAAGAAETKAKAFTAEEVAAIKAKFEKPTPNSIHMIRNGAFPPTAEAQ